MATIREGFVSAAWTIGAARNAKASTAARAQPERCVFTPLITPPAMPLRRKVFDERTPRTALVLPLDPLAEELDDEFTVYVERLDGGNMSLVDRLAHRPDFRHKVLSQMEMERLVHDVQPRTHRRDLLDRTGMDLDTAAIADKAHDRQRNVSRSHEQRFDRASFELPGIIGANAGHRLVPRKLQLVQHAWKLMRIGHGRPARLQLFQRHIGIVLEILDTGGGDRQRRGFARQRQFKRQPLPGFHIAVGAKVDLVQCLPMSVEELETALSPSRRLSFSTAKP